MKNVFEYSELTLLGSTGSVGRQTLELAAAKNIKINGIAANRSTAVVEEQARRFKPSFCVMNDKAAASDLKVRLADTSIKVLPNMTELIGATSGIVLNAVIGGAGLMPTLDTIEAGRELALANKESLVMAGELVMAKAKRLGVTVRPVDSEHSAIWQCQRAGAASEIKKLILTASGGPFFGMKRQELQDKTLSDALAHPTWKMGKAITIDSATLMNKGFEVIEASHLFGISADKIEVLIHKESIIHSMVEYIDNSIIAQMSIPDMRLCISHALTYPCRDTGLTPPLELSKLGALSFAEPDMKTFTLLDYAYRALRAGGALPAVLHAANEAAVNAFIDGKLKRFTDIQDIVCRVTEKLSFYSDVDASEESALDGIMSADREAGEMVKTIVGIKD